MIEKIKKRVKTWKRFYAQDCKHANENSSWYEILMELEYYNLSEFYAVGLQKTQAAMATIGTFSPEEQKFLETLPAYTAVKLDLKEDISRENFTETIEGMKVFSICGAQDDFLPIREYTIVTDRQDLWGLEIYVFRNSYHCRCGRHGIICYAKEPPSRYIEPEDTDIPF